MTREQVLHAAAHPEQYPTWRLDLARSDANWHRLYDAEETLRRAVAGRWAR